MADRIARLERYAEYIDEDLKELWNALDRHAEQAQDAVHKEAAKIRGEAERREADRREALQGSIVRQRIGALCVLVGLLLATVGSVA